MKLKTLLLGSAAAMIAFTGARAADAVIAEPEPVDFVRVCDMYGAGFFYIPGTETCLQISGYVDVQYEYTARDGNGAIAVDAAGADVNPVTAANLGTVVGFRDDGIGRSSLGGAGYTGRVNFDARSETDYGTLRSYIRVESQGGNNTGTAAAFMRDVYIELGGFSMGYRFNNWNLAGHRNMVLDNNDSFQRDFYGQYTYAANGFSASVGVLVDDASGVSGIDGGTAVVRRARAATDAGRSIDPYARLAYAASIFTLTGSVAYDSSAEETAYGVRLDVTPIDGLNIWGWYEGETGVTDIAVHEDFYGVGASYGITDTITLAAGYSFADNPHGTGTNFVPLIDSDITRYNLALTWDVAPGLTMFADYEHREFDRRGGLSDVDDDQFRVRFRRSF